MDRVFLNNLLGIKMNNYLQKKFDELLVKYNYKLSENYFLFL